MKFLLGSKYDEGIQFPYKLCGQNIDEEYDYTILFRNSFNEFFGH
jgi:hypothetical protein